MRYLTILFVLLLAACAAPAAQTPTTTSAPSATPTPLATSSPLPSATRAPTATRTSLPTATTTATAQPTTATAAAAATPAAATARYDDEILEAIRKSAAADTYRLVITLAGSGKFGDISFPNSSQPTSLFDMEGAFSGADYEFMLKGFLASMLGAGPDGLRIIRADGVSYAHGPLTFIGAPEAVWYRLSVAQAALANPPVSAATTLNQIISSNPDFSGFSLGSGVDQNGQRCQSYNGDRGATIALLQSLAQSGLPATSAPENTSEAKSAIVICPDGYLHRLSLNISGTNPGASPQPFSYVLDVQIDDFNTAIDIQAPPNPQDLPSSPIQPAPKP